MKYIAIEPISRGICTGCIFKSNNYESVNCKNPDSLTYNCCPNNRHTYIFTLLNIKLSINIRIL